MQPIESIIPVHSATRRNLRTKSQTMKRNLPVSNDIAADEEEEGKGKWIERGMREGKKMPTKAGTGE
jgi:hypothetical protein